MERGFHRSETSAPSGVMDASTGPAVGATVLPRQFPMYGAAEFPSDRSKNEMMNSMAAEMLSADCE